MARKRLYDELALWPYVVAEAVCEQPYKSEFSAQLTNPDEVARIEAKRQKMTRAEIEAFATRADERCRLAYEAGADWLVKCVTCKGTTGRDQLYVYMRHWLHAYLINPTRFLRKE